MPNNRKFYICTQYEYYDGVLVIKVDRDAEESYLFQPTSLLFSFCVIVIVLLIMCYCEHVSDQNWQGYRKELLPTHLIVIVIVIVLLLLCYFCCVIVIVLLLFCYCYCVIVIVYCYCVIVILLLLSWHYYCVIIIVYCDQVGDQS